MLNRRRFALIAAIATAGVVPLAAVPLAPAEEPDTLPDTHRASPRTRTRSGRGRPPRRRSSAAARTTTVRQRASAQKQLEP